MVREAVLRVQLAEIQEELRESAEAQLTVAGESIVGQTLTAGTNRLRKREMALLAQLKALGC